MKDAKHALAGIAKDLGIKVQDHNAGCQLSEASRAEIRFIPECYYVVMIWMMDAWRPHYRDRRTIQLHTSMSGAEAELAIAARSLGADRVGIARLTPQGLAFEPTANSEQPTPTTNKEEGATR